MDDFNTYARLFNALGNWFAGALAGTSISVNNPSLYHALLKGNIWSHAE